MRDKSLIIRSMQIREYVLGRVRDYTSATGLKETTLAGRAVKDSRFITRLRADKAVSLVNVERLCHFIATELEARDRPSVAGEPICPR